MGCELKRQLSEPGEACADSMVGCSEMLGSGQTSDAAAVHVVVLSFRCCLELRNSSEVVRSVTPCPIAMKLR